MIVYWNEIKDWLVDVEVGIKRLVDVLVGWRVLIVVCIY